jgi:hypothetical protein
MNLGCICLRGPSYLCLVSFGFLVCRDFKGSGSARQRLRLTWLEVGTAKAQAGRFARQKGAEFDGLVDRHLAVLRIGQLIKNGMAVHTQFDHCLPAASSNGVSDGASVQAAKRATSSGRASSDEP